MMDEASTSTTSAAGGAGAAAAATAEPISMGKQPGAGGDTGGAGLWIEELQAQRDVAKQMADQVRCRHT